MHGADDYSELWNDMDELLIRYPELTELWLDRDKVAALRSRYQAQQELYNYFRKRAFASLVMEKIFRVYEMTNEGQEEAEGIAIDNPELWQIWNQDVKDEYSDFPEFVDFVEKEVFTRT